jgi:hypothetical protein
LLQDEADQKNIQTSNEIDVKTAKVPSSTESELVNGPSKTVQQALGELVAARQTKNPKKLIAKQQKLLKQQAEKESGGKAKAKPVKKGAKKVPVKLPVNVVRTIFILYLKFSMTMYCCHKKSHRRQRKFQYIEILTAFFILFEHG